MTLDPAEIRRLVRYVTARTGAPLNDDDLVQEASLRALQALRRVGQVHHPKAFLMKIVCDTVRDHWRRRRPPESIASIADRFIGIHPNLEAEIDRRRLTALVQTALLRLNGPRRRLLRQFYDDELSLAEIARLQNCSLSAVKMQLVRARQELARIMRVLGAKMSQEARL